MFYLLLILLYAPQSQAAQRKPASAVIWEAAELNPSSVGLPYKIELQLVMLKNAGWSLEQVKQDAQNFSQVITQCQVQLARAELQMIAPPNGIINYEKFEKGEGSTAPNSLRGLARNFLSLKRPLIFFVHDFFLKGESSTGRSTAFSRANFRDSNEPPLPEEMLNTVWIPAFANDPAYYENCRSNHYFVFSHELAHILTGEPSHNNDPEPNILSLCLGGKCNNTFTAKQCEQVRASPLVTK